ncbi:16S rRNA (uracil(1498)-N(3))-methyltransferase [bacterium]|nr:16S rRNA (uracil(1498)-N(3))-methyltransferase [candidate division CSSED10-310 bacterium]
MKPERFFIDAIPAEGASAVLPPSELHHARSVMRLRDGQPLILIDGAGTEADGILRLPSSHTALVEIQQRRWTPRISHRIMLAIGVPEQRDILSDVIRGAIQLGVTDIHLLQTGYAGSRHLREPSTLIDRCRRVLISACKQCGQIWFPRMHGVDSLAAFLSGHADACRVFCGWEPRLGDLLHAEESRGSGDPAGDLVWLIGPEGGWSESDCGLLDQHKICTVRLGSLTLTTHVAALAGLSAMLTRFNRW